VRLGLVFKLHDGPSAVMFARRIGGNARGLRRVNITAGQQQAWMSTDGNHKCRVVVITSGKGGVGKTTTAASLAYGLAEAGHKTCVIDFDIGLRNLDIHLGCERRVIFDFVNVINGECRLNQALIKDKREPNLYLLAASQTKDKTSLTEEGVGKVIEDLSAEFDFVLCDSPAGIESGARHAMYFADDAIICTNPELSSCRDSDKMVGFIDSKAKKAAELGGKVRQWLLITRYDPERVAAEESLSMQDIGDILGLPLIGVIPESKHVLTSSNMGQPVILGAKSDAAEAYKDMVDRFLGKEVELRFVHPKEKGFFSSFFGSSN
jgi:septum site-determining protein MinD